MRASRAHSFTLGEGPSIFDVLFPFPSGVYDVASVYDRLPSVDSVAYNVGRGVTDSAQQYTTYVAINLAVLGVAGVIAYKIFVD